MKIDAEVIILVTVAIVVLLAVTMALGWVAENVSRALRLEERLAQVHDYVFSRAWARHVVAATYSVSAILIYASEGIRKSSILFWLDCTAVTILLLIDKLERRWTKLERRWTKDRWKNRVQETRWHFK